MGSSKDLFNKIKALIASHGGSISGDASGGSFTVPVPLLGNVARTYSVSGQAVTIHITARSFFLPCATIQNFVCSKVPNVEAATMSNF